MHIHAVVRFGRFPFVLIIILLSLFLSAWADPQQKQVIRVGVYDNPPKIYSNSDGTVGGFWPTIMNAIAVKENWQIVWVKGTWDESLARLASGEIDIMPDVGYTEVRASLYTFSHETVLTSWARLYVPQDSTIETITDLEGKKVAGLMGSLNFDGPEGIKVLADEFGVKCEFIGLDSYDKVFAALQNNQVDAGVANKDFGDLNESKYNVKRTPLILAPVSLRFAFTKDTALTATLMKAIDADLKAYKADESSIYYQALDDYLAENTIQTPQKVIPNWVYWVGVNAALVIFILLMLVFFARRQVARQTESLRVSEERNRVLIENNPDKLFRISGTGRYLDYHAGMSSELYAPPEEFLNKDIKEIMPPDVATLEMANLKKAVKTRKNQVFEYQLPINGKIRDLESRMTVSGKDEVIEIVRDITDRKQAERELQTSESRYATLSRVVPVGIFRTDNNGSTTYVNPTWCQISGLSSKEALGDGWLKAVHPDDQALLKSNWYESAQSNRSSSADYRFVHPDGKVTWVIGQAVPEKDSTGRVIGYVGTITDITERKKMEELKEAVIKAESADRLKSAFLATMSHELRTPLNSIIGFTGILLQKLVGPLSEEQDKQLRMIQSSARHLLELINDVLDISKIEAGQMKVVFESFDMKDVVQNCLDKISPLAEKKALKLIADLPPKPLQITSDRRRVEQVLLNLLNNAVKFTEKGEVRLQCKVAKSILVTSVSDTGIGIKPEDLQNLFKPFSQVETGISRQFEGTGLGLSICKHLVELLGGSISVTSVVGRGSVFTFILPLEERKSEK